MNSNGKRPAARPSTQKRVVAQEAKRPQNQRPRQAVQEQRPPSNARAQDRRQVKRPPPQNPSKPKRPSGLSDNLLSQTPLNRQMRKKNAPSEPGTVRRKNTQYFKISQNGKKRQKQQRGKQNRSFAKRVILLGIIGYVILLPIAVLTVTLLLKANVASVTGNFSYQLGQGKNTLSRKTYPFVRIHRDDVYYIDMDSLADYCKLTTTGDGKYMRYVVRESSESVEFVIGESIAYINGVPERTGGNAFMYEGKVHIPLEFAKRCFLNLDISLDTKKNTIMIVRQTDEKGNYVPLDFPYKLVDDTDKIIFGDLDVDIQEQIIKQNQPAIPEDGSGTENTN